MVPALYEYLADVDALPAGAQGGLHRLAAANDRDAAHRSVDVDAAVPRVGRRLDLYRSRRQQPKRMLHNLHTYLQNIYL